MSIWTDIHSKHYAQHSIAIFAMHFHGQGTWVTFRTTLDRLSNQLMLVGVVEDDVVKVNRSVPVVVAEHLQVSLTEALKAFESFEKDVMGEDDYPYADYPSISFMGILDNGRLQFLPTTHTKVFNLSESVGVATTKQLSYHFFVTQSKKNLPRLMREVGVLK